MHFYLSFCLLAVTCFTAVEKFKVLGAVLAKLGKSKVLVKVVVAQAFQLFYLKQQAVSRSGPFFYFLF